MTLTDGDIKKLKKVFATKDDLKKAIEENNKILISDIADRMDEVFAKYRDETAIKFDPIIREVQTEPNERAILSNRLEEHEDRITTLEAKAN